MVCMSSLVVAFITEEPTPDVYSLYLDFVGDREIDDDEGAFPMDVDWYVTDQNFNKKDLIIYRKPSSGKSLWSRFVHYDTVSVLANMAYANGYVPDVVIAPGIAELFVHDGQHNASDYARLLLDYPSYYVTFCMWHS